MHAYDLYLPLTYNDGLPVSHETREEIENDLQIIFGGFTAHPTCRGVWVDETGQMYSDDIRIYTIFTADPATLIATAAHLADRLDQKSIALVTPERNVRLIGRDLLTFAA